MSASLNLLAAGGTGAAGIAAHGPLLAAVPIAVAAGLVSFLSPCVLPLVPGYLSLITGLSGAELAADEATNAQRENSAPAIAPAAHKAERQRMGAGSVIAELDRPALILPAAAVHRRSRVIAGGGLFIAGFTVVFVAYGALFGGLGRALALHRQALDVVFGSLTIGLGLLFMGVLQRWSFSGRELRLQRTVRVGMAGAPVLGVLFGLGWTPCIGPTLAAVLGLSADSGTAARGALLALTYCVGLGLPFLLCGLGYRRALGAMEVLRRHAGAVSVAGGLLLVGLGLLEVTGQWAVLVSHLQGWIGATTPAL